MLTLFQASAHRPHTNMRGILWKNNEYGSGQREMAPLLHIFGMPVTNTWREAALAGYQPHVWYYVMGTISGEYPNT